MVFLDDFAVFLKVEELFSEEKLRKSSDICMEKCFKVEIENFCTFSLKKYKIIDCCMKSLRSGAGKHMLLGEKKRGLQGTEP